MVLELFDMIEDLDLADFKLLSFQILKVKC